MMTRRSCNASGTVRKMSGRIPVSAGPFRSACSICRPATPSTTISSLRSFSSVSGFTGAAADDAYSSAIIHSDGAPFASSPAAASSSTSPAKTPEEQWQSETHRRILSAAKERDVPALLSTVEPAAKLDVCNLVAAVQAFATVGSDHPGLWRGRFEK